MYNGNKKGRANNMGRTSSTVKDRYNQKAYTSISFRTFPESKAIIEETARQTHESVSHLINRLLQEEAKKYGLTMTIPEQSEYVSK